jgi:simple sugar transport system ATP-binding protein
LNSCSLNVTAGAVHGLLGKNGAGKSTLVGIVAGAVRPDSGTVIFDGEDVTHLPIVQRQQAGISVLDQHPQLCPTLTVAENLLLPHYPRRRGLISWRQVKRSGQAALDEYDAQLNVDDEVGDLSVSDQRRLSIIRALAGGGRMILLDEPTASLTRTERGAFFSWIRGLNARDRTFLFISHFTSEIRELCDEYTVLRNGDVVDAGTSPKDLSASELSRRVVGEEVHEFRRTTPARPLPTLLELTDFAPTGMTAFDLSVGRGEIVGFVGLPGSGAATAARALVGLHPTRSGTVLVEDRRLRLRGVADAIAGGIAYLTGDRLGEGVVPGMSVSESTVLGSWPTRGSGLIDRSAIERTFDLARRQLSIVSTGGGQQIDELSGGNQQKVIIGRLLATHPKVLVLEEPTHGLDVGVKEEVHRLIDAYSNEGNAVVVLAYDPDEMVRLVDRAIVFRDGRVVSELAGERLTVDGVVSTVDAVIAPHPEGQQVDDS